MAYSLTYSYDSTSESYSVIGYSNITTSDKVVIPSTYNDGTNGEHPVTSIGPSAFKGCSSLTRVTIPNNITSIGNSAFSGCSSLTSAYITDIAAWCKILFGDYYANPLSYARNLYLNNELVTELTIPDSVTSIGSYAFFNCSSLTSITIPNSVTSIGSYAFNGCSSSTSIIIPNSVTSIGSYAFSRCWSLTSVTIPNNVTSIGSYAFSGCSGLKQLILLPSAPPTLGSSAIPTNVQSIYVQQSSKAAYQTNWTTFASKIVSDNIYLSFVRFNQKNKEYIDGKVREKEKIYDEDNNKQYTYQLKIKDGFPVLTMVEAEATI